MLLLLLLLFTSFQMRIHRPQLFPPSALGSVAFGVFLLVDVPRPDRPSGQNRRGGTESVWFFVVRSHRNRHPRGLVQPCPSVFTMSNSYSDALSTKSRRSRYYTLSTGPGWIQSSSVVDRIVVTSSESLVSHFGCGCCSRCTTTVSTLWCRCHFQ